MDGYHSKIKTMHAAPQHLLKTIWQALYFFAALLLLLTGLSTLVIATQPFNSLKLLADHLARDGSMQSFTPQLFAQLTAWLPVSGGLFVVGAAVLLIFRLKVQSYLRFLVGCAWSSWLSLPSDTRTVFSEVRHRLLTRSVLIPAAGLTLFAFLARFWFINNPVGHDEAYNFTVFAVHPLSLGLADYHFPNNHLFHTFLLHIAYRLFGADTWVLRLPAFTAGVLLAPFGYLLARRLYNPTSALLAGAAIAAAPVLISYASTSRGYSLLVLLTLVLLILAVELKHRSNTLLWLGFILAASFGLYTIPIFVYPLGIVYTWLGLAWLLKDLGPGWTRSRFFAAVFFSVIGIILLTDLLYMPVFRSSGISSVFANSYVRSLSWVDFKSSLILRLQETWLEWNQAVPLLAAILALVGLAASIWFHLRLCRERISIMIAGLLFLPLILLIQRPNAWARLWLFLVPLVLTWCAAGLIGLSRLLDSRLKSPTAFTSAFSAVLIIAMVTGSAVRTLQVFPGLKSEYGPVEQAAIYLRDHLADQQIVIVTSIDDAPLWYYFYKYHLSQELFRRNIPFRSAYVVVSTDRKQTLASVLKARGPDPVFMDMPAAHLVAQFGPIDLYQVPSRWETVKKEYHLDQP
jgi:uncharacterized membrane protein